MGFFFPIPQSHLYLRSKDVIGYYTFQDRDKMDKEEDTGLIKGHAIFFFIQVCGKDRKGLEI